MHTQTPHILVVEDSASLTKVLLQRFAEEGFRVVSCRSAEEAVEENRRENFDVFIVDLALPGISGLELLAGLDIDNRPAEAIITTGIRDTGVIRQCMEMGAFSYIVKPYELDDLLLSVRKAYEMVVLKKRWHEYVRDLEQSIDERTSELRTLLEIAQRKQELLDVLLNSVGEGILALDTSENVVIVNKCAEEILRLTFAEAVGRKLEQVAGNHRLLYQLIPRLRETSTREKPSKLLVYADTMDGDTRCYAVHITRLQSRAGLVQGRIVTFIDETEKVRAEQLRNSIISVVAHELRTPVSIMENYLNILRMQKPGRPALFEEILPDMTSVHHRMKALVERIVQVGEMAIAPQDLVYAQVNMELLFDNAESQVKRECERRGVRCVRDLGGVTGPVTSHADLVGLILQCLLDNAVKYSPDGATVYWGARMIMLDAHPGLELTVADSGPGIDDTVRSYLFQSFIQGENALTRKHSGIGTGLYLVKRAVTTLDGHLDIAGNGETGGTRVVVVLPLEREH